MDKLRMARTGSDSGFGARRRNPGKHGALIMAPERYYNVSLTQLSLARHYGSARIHGQTYVYDSGTDTLIRQDVWTKIMREQSEEAEQINKAERERWMRAQDDLFQEQA